MDAGIQVAGMQTLRPCKLDPGIYRLNCQQKNIFFCSNEVGPKELWTTLRDVWIKLMDEIWKTSLFPTLSPTALSTLRPQPNYLKYNKFYFFF